jgi:hypothetical protein
MMVWPLILHGTVSRFMPRRVYSAALGSLVASPRLQNSTPMELTLNSAA